MEKYTVFMDWKNQHCQNGHTTQSNLQIQCNPYQLPTVFFTELEQIISQLVWKYKTPQIAKAIFRKKNGTGGINLPDFRLQSHSHQDRNIDQWNKIGSQEINPRTYGHLIFNKGGKNIKWRKEAVLGKLVNHLEKNETRTLSNTIHKNKLKMDKRSKHKTRNYKTLRGKHKNTLQRKSHQDPL